MKLELTVDRSNPEFEPIERGEKNKERKYYCMGCSLITPSSLLGKGGGLR
jgi:hypothetical protein